MKLYEVMVEGSNYLINEEGQEKSIGFFVTKYVEADNISDAKEKALSFVESDPYLAEKNIRRDITCPSLLVDSIDELDELPDQKVGYSFYMEE